VQADQGRTHLHDLTFGGGSPSWAVPRGPALATPFSDRRRLHPAAAAPSGGPPPPPRRGGVVPQAPAPRPPQGPRRPRRPATRAARYPLPPGGMATHPPQTPRMGSPLQAIKPRPSAGPQVAKTDQANNVFGTGSLLSFLSIDISPPPPVAPSSLDSAPRPAAGGREGTRRSLPRGDGSPGPLGLPYPSHKGGGGGRGGG